MLKWDEYRKTTLSRGEKGDVLCQQNTAHQEQVMKREAYVKLLADTVRTLGKLGLPFRGHDESSDSNNQGVFKEICKLHGKYNDNFKSIHEQRMNYTSKYVQNDLIDCWAQTTRNKIINEIRESGMMAIMCDEARSHKEEQLSICVCYPVDLQIKERFLGFVDVCKCQDATFIFEAILSFLKDNRLEDVKIVGQSHDGASVMSGQKGGVQTKIRKIHPFALYIHCFAHRLNLAVIDSCNQLQDARKFFNTIEAIYVHFNQPTRNT